MARKSRYANGYVRDLHPAIFGVPERVMVGRYMGYVRLDPRIFLDKKHSELSIRKQHDYLYGLALSAAAGIPVELDPDHGCGVVLRQRRAWSAAQRQEIYDRDGNACTHCGATDDLVLDHIVPLARGGGDGPGNLQTLCAPCNRRKWAHLEVPS